MHHNQGQGHRSWRVSDLLYPVLNALIGRSLGAGETSLGVCLVSRWIHVSVQQHLGSANKGMEKN